jgi:hypothetical protein
MTKIDAAQRIIDDLTTKHRALTEKAEEMAVQRRELSYAAHTGDHSAKAKLDKLTKESLTLGLEQDNVASALAEASKRLAVAQAAEAVEQEREQAKRRRQAAKKLKAASAKATTAAAEWVAAVNEMRAAVDEIRVTGSTFPSDEQFIVHGQLATNTLLMGLPWQPEVHVAPQYRKTFLQLGAAWSGTIDRQVAVILGEGGKEAA